MRYRLFGPVEVLAGGHPVNAGPRVVLAALLVDAGRVVRTEVLAERVWGDSTPQDAGGSLRAHLTRIRRVLRTADQLDPGPSGPAPLLHRAGGYVLQVDRDQVDLHRFRRLLGQARDPAAEPARRLDVLRTALALREGDPLTGVEGQWAARTRQAWLREQVDAMVDWAEAELEHGDPAVVLGPLGDLAVQHPFVESVVASQLRALNATGRAAEALALYGQTRQRLADELGTDPGPALQAVHQALLRNELGGAFPPVRSRDVTVPAQLPADVPGFAGRADELERLDALLVDSAGETPATVVITALSGTAGVGKTALAVHWAHRVAEQFPDGQLYVNLRGFDPGGAVMPAAEALRGFLEALGVPPPEIPTEPDAQVGLFRSVLAGRRVLVLVDNARDAEHARPLLPASPTAVAVVTSRNQLGSLLTADGAHPIVLDPLTPAEATELLARRLGQARLQAEAAAAGRIIEACARLPLALRIVAARAQQTGFSLQALAQELSDEGQRLDTLDTGDPRTAVRAVFSWSYATLQAQAARLFRLLGLHPGADLAVPAAASLVALPRPQTRALLHELVRANLLTEHRPGRYGLHDLLRVYASELVEGTDSAAERRTASERLFDHYTHTAQAADTVLNPHRDPSPLPLGVPATGTDVEQFGDYQAGMAWLSAECDVLLAVLHRAADAGSPTHAWQLAWALQTFLDRRGRWDDLAISSHAALRAALAASSGIGPAAAAAAYRALGRVDSRLGRYPEAHERFGRALRLFERTGDLVAQAYTHNNVAIVWERQHELGRAVDHAGQALVLYRAAGHRRGEAYALNNLGWYHAQLGDPDRALDSCRQALTILQEVGEQEGVAHTWDSLGYAHHRAGAHTDADECYRQAVHLFGELGDRFNEAVSLLNLGDARLAAGRAEAARSVWRQSLDLLLNLQHPKAAEARERLHRPSTPGAVRRTG